MLIKSKRFSWVLFGLILNIFLFSLLRADVELKTDKNGYTYETVKENENLGRLYTLPNGLKVYMAQNKLKPVIDRKSVV